MRAVSYRRAAASLPQGCRLMLARIREGGCGHLPLWHARRMKTATLRFPFVKNGYRHDLLERTGNVCLVERTSRSIGSVHWEVVVLHHAPARTWPDGRRQSAGECYPRTSWWGQSGWTYNVLHDARERFAALVRSGRFCTRGSRTATELIEGDELPSDAAQESATQ